MSKFRNMNTERKDSHEQGKQRFSSGVSTTVPIFQDLSPEELKQVEDIAISRSIHKKTVIFSEGSEKEAVFSFVPEL